MSVSYCRIFAVVVGAVTGVFALAAQSQQATKSNAGHDASNPVHAIVLPQYAPEISTGPNVDTYRKYCLVCHSAQYVAMQPRFPQAVWEREVKKMIDAYGAVIPEADQHEIVEYLVAVRGPSKSR
ncbi:MAG TPA: cytochrome c [Candidatus Eisenbacteria bacterium]|nr:cytochrome c [Candidatus Eisenbacteria bacterium]